MFVVVGQPDLAR